MKKYMRQIVDDFGIQLPAWACNDQRDPELNEINIWFREQYHAYQRAKQKLDTVPHEATNVVSLFQAYHNRVHDACVTKAQQYLDRVIFLAENPEQNPGVNFAFGSAK